MSRSRKFLLAGNWKMNKLQKDLEGFFTGLKKEVKFDIASNNKVDVLFALPYTFLEKAVGLTRGTGITIASFWCLYWRGIYFDASRSRSKFYFDRS